MRRGRGKLVWTGKIKGGKGRKLRITFFFKERIYRQAEKDGVEKVIGGNDRE